MPCRLVTSVFIASWTGSRCARRLSPSWEKPKPRNVWLVDLSQQSNCSRWILREHCSASCHRAALAMQHFIYRLFCSRHSAMRMIFTLLRYVFQFWYDREEECRTVFLVLFSNRLGCFSVWNWAWISRYSVTDFDLYVETFVVTECRMC